MWKYPDNVITSRVATFKTAVVWPGSPKHRHGGVVGHLLHQDGPTLCLLPAYGEKASRSDG